MNAESKKRYKDIDFPFVCPITNRVFNSGKGLSVYVTKSLKMNHSEYYDYYVGHRDSKCFFCGDKGKFISISKGYRNMCDNEECVKKSFQSNTVEGIMYRNFVSKEEAEVILEKSISEQFEKRMESQKKLRTDDPLWDKKRSRNCKEFWILKGFSEEESVLKVKEVMIDIHTKTFKKFKDNPEKYASKYTSKIEYYLNKGFSEKDANEELSKRQTTFSLDKCIERYGEVEGFNRWKKRQDDWTNTMDSKTEEEKIEINRKKMMNGSGYSKISQEIFHKIQSYYPENNIRYEELNSEFVVYDNKEKKYYKYDYVDFTKKKVIEFNGDYWHCNPIKYNEDYVHPILNKSAKELWEKDKIKKSWIENKGYILFTIWESEYRKEPQQILEKCLQFLNS
jgi:hypothetical protein